MDMNAGKVIHIDFPGHYLTTDPTSLTVPSTKPPPLAGTDNVESANRPRMPPPMTPQEYLPDELRGTAFYAPGPFGYERKVAERMAWWERKKREGEGGESAGESPADESAGG